MSAPRPSPAPPVAMTPWHRIGPRVPRRGNRFTRWLGRRGLALAGWRVTGEFPDLSKCVIAVAPHTSNWDFMVGVFAMYAIGFRVSFFGKDTLFRPPLGWFMRWLGGEPVDRRSSHGVVEQTVQAIRAARAMILVIAPEGTRKRVTNWRTGFYHVAHGAGLPIVPAAFDYRRREVRLEPLIWTTGDVEGDLARLQAVFRRATGKRPDQFATAADGS